MNTVDQQNIANQLADAGLPPEIVNWLAKLKLLYGLPFHYLIPNESFLPPESIRFFSIDPDWIGSVTDGAMSIGRHNNGADAPPGTYHSDLVHLKLLHQKPAEHVHNIRRFQLNQAAEPAADDALKGMSGFILRSAVVHGWPGMDIIGYPKGASPYDYETGVITNTDQIKSLTNLRLAPLSNSVILGIFQGPLYELVLHQPPEAIHFAFSQIDTDANKVNKTLRVPTINWDDPTTQYETNDFQDRPLTGVFADKTERVLDMMQLSKALAAQLAKPKPSGPGMAPGYYKADAPDDCAKSGSDACNFKNHLVASDFALEMTKGVGLVSFINE